MIRFAAPMLALVAMLQQTPPSPGPTPVPSPSPTAAASATPAPSPAPTASVTPAASPSAAPSALPTPLVLPPDAPPQILAVSVSSNVLHSGDSVTGIVITSTNVAAVEVRLKGHAMRLTRSDAGVWSMQYAVPKIPFWLRKTYTADVVAMNTAGVEVSQPLTLSIR